MIIEFIGVPGAGKSTLLRVTSDSLTQLGFKAMRVHKCAIYCLKRMLLGHLICLITPIKWQERVLFGVFRRLILLYRVKFALKNKKLVGQVVRLIIQHPMSWKDKRLVMRWFLRDISYHQFFGDRLQEDEILILDEGVVHRATSIFASPFEEPNPDLIINYTTLLPKSDLIIWVQAPLDTCVKRVISRGIHQRYWDEELRLFIINSNKTIQIAIQSIKEKAWNIIQVNNIDLDTSIVELHKCLVKHFGASE